MKRHTGLNRIVAAGAATLLCAAALLSASADAQSLSDEWRFRAVIYMWGPTIKGAATFPGGNTADFDMSLRTILDHLKMTDMGTLEAQKGRWGAFTDVVYMNLGGLRVARQVASRGEVLSQNRGDLLATLTLRAVASVLHPPVETTAESTAE